MTKSKKKTGSAQKVSTGQNTAGRRTDREKISSMKRMPADHPFFSRGFMIGATRLRNSSPKKSFPKPSKKGEL